MKESQKLRAFFGVCLFLMFLKSFHGSSLFLGIVLFALIFQCYAWQEGAFGPNTLLRSFPHAAIRCCTSEIQHIDDVVANFSQEFLSGGAAGQSLKARCIYELALHATLTENIYLTSRLRSLPCP